MCQTERPQTEVWGLLRVMSARDLPAALDRPQVPIEVLSDEPAMATPHIGEVVISVGVAVIAGAVVAVIVTAPGRTNTNAHRARAYPNALRVCRR